MGLSAPPSLYPLPMLASGPSNPSHRGLTLVPTTHLSMPTAVRAQTHPPNQCSKGRSALSAPFWRSQPLLRHSPWSRSLVRMDTPTTGASGSMDLCASTLRALLFGNKAAVPQAQPGGRRVPRDSEHLKKSLRQRSRTMLNARAPTAPQSGWVPKALNHARNQTPSEMRGVRGLHSLRAAATAESKISAM